MKDPCLDCLGFGVASERRRQGEGEESKLRPRGFNYAGRSRRPQGRPVVTQRRRAQLREAGYDAIGAVTLSRALRHPPDDAERGPVRLMVVDSGAAAAEPEALEHVRRRYPGVAFVLVPRAGAVPPGPWAATLRRPVTIGDIFVNLSCGWSRV